MNNLSIDWSHGRASVQSLGAMLAPVDFALPDGRSISPLHTAPWAFEALCENTPAILQALRGEWPCVPFGAADVSTLSSRWRLLDAQAEPEPHGYAANSHWQLQRINNEAVKTTIQYPEHHAIQSLERLIQATPGKAELALELTVNSRLDTRIPIGLHPVFKLPEQPETLQLIPDHVDQVWTYPGDTGGPTLFMPDAQCNTLSAVPGVKGSNINATCLPFKGSSEDLLLLTGTNGRFDLLHRSERYRVVLRWDAEHFPSVLLWISNKGRQDKPWSGRHLALGVEPVCAAFDLGTDISAGDNPLAQQGIKTALALRACHPWTTRYSIAVESAV